MKKINMATTEEAEEFAKVWFHQAAKAIAIFGIIALLYVLHIL